jgi:predicted Ser/Thr protein kinase
MNCPACQADNPPGAEVCFHCRTVLSAITRGTLVGGRYEVRRPLGSGGMGTVYEAHDRMLDEDVALKVLKAELAQSPGMADRLRSEIKLARQVSHPNVCRIHEYGEDGSLRFLSMERVQGTNLKDVLRRRGGLPEKEAIDIAVQAADGLAAIHEKGVIHRDLKTLNLTVDENGLVRVMDFGIATRAGDGGGVTGKGYVVGSPEYMSPEQARGRPLDFRSDIYALGIVLYELLTGRVPFRGETPVETLLMHLEAPPPLEGAAGVAIPPRLVPVLKRALAKDPRDRFASAAEMAAALRAARAGGPPLPKARRAVVAGALGAAVLVAGGVFLAMSGPRRLPAAGAPVSPPAESSASVQVPPVAPSPEAPAHSDPTPAGRAASPPIESPRLPRTAIRRSPREASADSPAGKPADAPNGAKTAETPEAAPTPEARAENPEPAPSRDAPPGSAAAVSPVADGALLVVVTPWADVAVDERAVGQTPLARIPLGPGAHSVVLSHPDYQPYPRKVTIKPGETFRLVVDLASDGVRRRP